MNGQKYLHGRLFKFCFPYSFYYNMIFCEMSINLYLFSYSLNLYLFSYSSNYLRPLVTVRTPYTILVPSNTPIYLSLLFLYIHVFLIPKYHYQLLFFPTLKFQQDGTLSHSDYSVFQSKYVLVYY